MATILQTPLLKQCFVTAGVSINMASMGLVMGLATVLLPQLKQPDSPIQIDDSSGSWIAAIPGFSIIVGNFIIPSIMTRLGRRIANLSTIAVSAFGWLCVIFSNSLELMIAARFIQGISIGMIAILGPVLIGEYTSPRNRGAFLMTIALSIGLGVFLIHTTGMYLHWQTCSYICMALVLVDLLIVVFSPESPSWLADKGRYDECKKVFRYLRGDKEEDELEKMVAASIIANKERETIDSKKSLCEKIQANLQYLKTTVKEKAFYKPIFIMLHVYTMAQWSGVNIVTSYIIDLVDNVVGSEANVAVMVMSIDIQRIISSVISLILIKKIRRRVLIFLTNSLTIIMYLVIAAYTYAKHNDLLPFDSPYIGIVLIHIQVFSIVTGALPISYVLAGELYPLQYKGLCGGISTFFMSMNVFCNVKTIPILFNSLGFPETCLLYAGVIIYCMFIVGIFLPETKDRTLQDIEEELRGKKLTLPQ
ncbi:facilitated trehalose transporter Tret1-like [Aphomia sociella]